MLSLHEKQGLHNLSEIKKKLISELLIIGGCVLGAADSIPIEVTGIVIDLILPAATWPLGPTELLTEMSTRNIFGG